MTKFFVTFTLCFMLCSAFAQVDTEKTEEILTNQSIFDMVEMGFDSEIIVAKIKSSKTKFDTTIDKLSELKEKGISNEILKAMLSVTKSKDEKVEEKTGVFLLLRHGGEIKILPTAFSGTKTNLLASGLTYGIASGKVKATIHGEQSRNVVRAADCSFMFYFSPNDDGNVRAPDWWFRSATSPNEFALIKLARKRDCREVGIGSLNIYAGKRDGVSNKNIRSFTIEQVDDYTFKVTPTEPLEEGEYCFYYQGMIPQNNSSYKIQSVFDFSVMLH